MNHPLSTTLHANHLVPQVQSKAAERKSAGKQSASTMPFEQHLKKELDRTLTFSAHAADRLKQRNISLSNGDLETLNQAVSRVAKKGGKESLILFKNTAFVVSIPNRTVITAVDGNSMSDSVFTQIDSAMILT